MNYSGQLDSYSHPYYTMLHKDASYNAAAGAASGTAWGYFRSRNKVLVSRVSIVCRSTPSATNGTLKVFQNDTAGTALATVKTLTVSQCSAGWATSLSWTAVTLETLTQYMSMKFENNEKGKFDIIYEYQICYPVNY
jgi:hypothetical protein